MKTIRLDGVVGWEIRAAWLAEELEGAGDITVVLNSSGGDILEGFSVFELLKAHEGRVVAQVDFAASMASIIAMACDEIVMNENTSLMMIHRPWSGNVGNADELRRTADTLDKLEGMLSNIYLERAGEKLDSADLSKMLDDETWLTAEEAIEVGLADTMKKSGGAKNLMDAALVAMRGQDDLLKFDLNKLSTKMAAMAKDKKPLKVKLMSCDSLADVEGLLREDLNATQADATAIVAAVKRVTGDGGHNKVDVDSAFQSVLKTDLDVEAMFNRVIQSKL